MPVRELDIIKSSAAQILSNPTWDVLLVLALIGGTFFYGLMAGKRRIAATILYTYVALALTTALPIEKLTAVFKQDSFTVRASAFVALFLLLSLLLGSRRSRARTHPSAWWEIFLLSFLQVGLLIHLILGFLPAETITLLAPLTRTVFANPELHLWWLGVPLAVIILMRRIGTQEG